MSRKGPVDDKVFTHEVTVGTTGGPMNCRVSTPAAGGRHPVVVVCHDGPGIRPAVHEVADRVAAAGYVAILPDLYHRQGHFLSFDPAELRRGNDEERRRMIATVGATSVAEMVSDVRAARAALATDPAAQPGPAGIVGFCHTARTVLVSMADHPDEFAAGSIMHPSFVVTEGPESVHLVAGRIRGPIYAGFGAADRSAPLATQQPLIDELSRDGVPAKIEIHPGADHGYGFTGTPSFDQEAAERSWKGALDVLGRALAPND